MRWFLGWRYISSLHSADEFQEGRDSCPLLRSSCHIGVSKRLAVYCLSLYIFWLIRSLVDPTLVAFIVCGPLQFLVSHLKNRAVSINLGTVIKFFTETGSDRGMTKAKSTQ